jgi:hypothetical protein
MSITKVITGLTLTMLLGSGLAVAANQDRVNHFARVEAYSSIDGFQGKNYILLFLTYQTKAVIFDRSIEANTVKVPSKYCDS